MRAVLSVSDICVDPQVQDEPAHQGRWNEALETIADHRNSSRLKTYLETGADRKSSMLCYSGVSLS